MNDNAISINALSKQYCIGKREKAYRTLRDALSDAVTAPFRRAGKLLRGQASGASELDEKFWALKDLSFDIKRGDVVGIIGSNGAGKSTLLKILSRITDPTDGYVEIRGRVGSLLEVGTGFHPELSGRDNVYLNGAILGMKRAEIHGKFDEIVAFAEVDRFIDTPVKHYSSGMYLKLAFAVAAHLEPEILIVDEVLAVGDSRFQKKCLSKMQDVGQEGRTVLFVSHNMSAITRLCKRAIQLDEGRLVQDGIPQNVVGAYLNSGSDTMSERRWSDPEKAPGGELARLRAVRVKTEDGCTSDDFDIRKPIGLEMEYEVLEPGHTFMPHFSLDNEENITVFTTIDNVSEWRNKRRPAGIYVCTAWIPGNLLSEGMLYVEACLITVHPLLHQFTATNAVGFRVIDPFEGDSARVDWSKPMTGVVRPLLKWNEQFYPNNMTAGCLQNE